MGKDVKHNILCHEQPRTQEVPARDSNFGLLLV